MRPICLVTNRTLLLRQAAWTQRRSLLTLAIETSCDDTSVAVLEKHNHKSKLHFHSKVTSDNRLFQGVHPLVALESHQKKLAALVNTALESLPIQPSAIAHLGNTLLIDHGRGAQLRKKPNFVTVTRGPGMRANLNTGLDTAKGLAVAWQIPLLGVNHMQAHALTPRLVSSLDADDSSQGIEPAFPFVSLLVSGGHTMLVHSRGLCDHQILAQTSDIAIGDVIDKCARDILPASALGTAGSLTYGRLLEDFAFPNGSQDYNYTAPATRGEEIELKDVGYGWSLTPPLSQPPVGGKVRYAEFSYSGLGSTVKQIITSKPEISDVERRMLARETMRVAFEHLASRLLVALQSPELKAVDTIVVSGGVASNQYLKHVLRMNLDRRGFEHMRLTFPPPSLCTDNAAMIAWTGIEMWENGWRSDLGIRSLRKWAIDSTDRDGGVLGASGWISRKDGLRKCV
jgi:N6-L-threonylcarbamoyladenine synthase